MRSTAIVPKLLVHTDYKMYTFAIFRFPSLMV